MEQTTQAWLHQFFGMPCSQIEAQPEGQEYQAATLKLGTSFCYFRTAKITPIKVGQFVTFWKRIPHGTTIAFNVADQFDFLLVFVQKDELKGLFVFPKKVLIERDIVAHAGNKEGKRAFRVYPGWDTTYNKQAQTSQAWQLRYFFRKGVSDERENVALQKILQS